MTISVRSSKIRGLQHWGHKKRSTDVRPRFLQLIFELRTFVGSMLKLIEFLRHYIYWAYSIFVDLLFWANTIVDLFSYFRAFSDIFLNILKALFRVYIIIPINVDPRINRGCFSIRQRISGQMSMKDLYDTCVHKGANIK